MKYVTRRQRRGNVIALIAVLSPVLLGLGAFAIDVGYIAHARSRLQTAVDAAALAAVQELPGDQDTINNVALQYVTLNAQLATGLEVTAVAGKWNADSETFSTTSLAQADSIRVSAVSPRNGLFFGRVLGKSSVDCSASAIAQKPAGGGGVGTRFLIDDEMIDKDVEAIEDLADALGIDTEELVTARGFNEGKEYGDNDWTWEDNFLDIPEGEVLNLPTGQGTSYDNNDAGLFDIDFPEFPFTNDSDFMDFVMYSETGNDSSKWGTDTNYIKNNLDPLEGAAPVTNGDMYDSFVNPDFVHVSPVFESDVSTLNKKSGVPRLNAKGLRRGLLAFKIIEVGQDIDGGGSVLPELIIEIVDPSTIDPNYHSSSGQGGGGDTYRLVQ